VWRESTVTQERADNAESTVELERMELERMAASAIVKS
jgi:hypothetical protein